MVWSKPIREIAPSLEISDTMLGKICRQYNIPIPGRGYWAKVRAGQTPRTAPLPARGLGMSETISIGQDDWRGREGDARLMAEEIPPPPQFSESLSDLRERVQGLVGKVALQDLSRPVDVVSTLLKYDEKRAQKWRAADHAYSFDEPYFVSPYEKRRLRLLNSICAALSRLGISCSARTRNPVRFSASIGSTVLNFWLDHPKQKSDWHRAGSRIDRPSSEPLKLEIVWVAKLVNGLRLAWQDESGVPLEKSLREIVVELLVAGEMQYRAAEEWRYEDRVSRKVELIEQAKRKAAAAEKERVKELARVEKAKVDQLLQDAARFRLANDIRSFVAEAQRFNSERPDPLPDRELQDWASWALGQADGMDPVLSGALLRQAETPAPSEPDPSQDRQAAPLSEDASTAAEPWRPNRWYTKPHRG